MTTKAQRDESEMRYYKISMPTEPGWWWFKPNWDHAPEWEVVAVEMYDGKLMDASCPWDMPIERLADRGQFYGPRIVEPPAPEKT